jgi:hypothetical protein
MRTFGHNGSISQDGFRRLMLTLIGAHFTQAQILEAFGDLSRSGETITAAALTKFMAPNDVALLDAAAPRAENGAINFSAWTAQVFAR